MKNCNGIARARREAAASIQWPERTPLLFNPDPAEQARMKTVVICLVGAVLAFAILGASNGPLQQWARSSANDQMRPGMEAAMSAGNRAAGTWLATHFRKDYPGLLEHEADAGEPTAMFIVGRMLILGADASRQVEIDQSPAKKLEKAKGIALVKKAADAGNQDALAFLLERGAL
ncbi:TPA: hypothetical protein VDB83_005120 [Burkholderia cenocepacia]|nr:hypothetical protein [Burkholderia cenocepacia]